MKGVPRTPATVPIFFLRAGVRVPALELIAAGDGGRDRDLLELNIRIDLGGH